MFSCTNSKENNGKKNVTTQKAKFNNARVKNPYLYCVKESRTGNRGTANRGPFFFFLYMYRDVF